MKNDLRSIKTKNAINKAFIELLNEVGFSKINVQMIVKRAKINRSTFYLHYLDKYDLLEKFEDEILINLSSISTDAPVEFITKHNRDYGGLELYANKVVDYLYNNAQSLSLLMSDNGDPAFLQKLSKSVAAIWDKNNIPNQLSIPADYIESALIGCITSLISEWVKNDFDKPKSEFAEIILTLTLGIMESVIN